MRSSNVRSWRSDKYPCHSGKDPVHVSPVVSYSLGSWCCWCMDNDNLATAWSAQIQISISLICLVRKPSIEPIVLAKRWDITLRKHRRLSKPQCREGLWLCYTFHCQDDSEQMTEIFVIVALHILYSQTWCLPVQCPEGVTNVHKDMPQTLDGLELFLWHLEVKHMRPCCCCLLGWSPTSLYLQQH